MPLIVMKKYCLTCCVLLLGVFALGQTKSIAIIGSSTAAGAGADPEDSAWVNRLRHYYVTQQGTVSVIHNLAVPGSNNYQGMPSSYQPPPFKSSPDPERNITKAIQLNPDIIIISYVSNNLNEYSIEETMFTLQTMKDSANAAGKVCFITTTQPRDNFDDAGRERLRILKDSILNRFGYFAINFFDPLVGPNNMRHPDYAYPWDDVHINNARHRLLFEQVLAKNIIAAALPVNITQFKGSMQQGSAVLTWTAHDEELPTTYRIQHSTNGADFETVGEMAAIGGNAANNYTFTHTSPHAGANYYRLVISEPSGNSFSKMLVLKNNVTGIQIKRIFGSMATGTITLEVVSAKAQKVTMAVFTNDGKKLSTKEYYLSGEASNTIQMTMPNLPVGSYIVQITGDKGVQVTQPLIIW
jgi:hypothetical protein